MRMKASNPHIKVLPSVGGWTLSDPFFYLGNDANRATFVASVKEFLLTYTLFDGVDIDWEFPGGGGASATLGQASDAQTYVKLMRDLRAMLDEVETETGRDMELSSAIGTSPRFINNVDYANAAPYMDYIFMMTYDYKGAWSSETGHQTNLYASQITADDSLSINIAVNEMLKQNVDPAKLVVGVAKYGRGWSNVSGVTGNNPFAGTGGGALNESGYWEAGIMDYKLIEERYLGGNPEGNGVNGWQHLYDATADAAYLWNPTEKKLITFDSTRSVKAKGEYVLQHNLGGVFSWEIDGDNGSILNAMHEGMGHPAQ
jgi:chitinase